MNVRTIRVVLAAVLAVLSLGARGQRSHPVAETKNGKPVHDIDIMFVTPGNVEAFYTESDEVVEVTVTGHEARIVHNWPRTFYTATVIRSYKGDLRKGDGVSFSQFTGEVELPDEILRTNGRPPLPGAGPFVVFLRRNEYLGGRTLVGDISGAFLLRDGRVEPQGSRSALDERIVTEQQFSDALIRLGRHARPKA